MVGQRYLAEFRVAKRFGAVPVCGDVVGGPPGAELLAAGGQFPHYRSDGGRVRRSGSLGLQQPDRLIGGSRPLREDLFSVGVEKMNRARLGTAVALSNTGAYNARPSGLAATMSRLPVITIAGAVAILSIRACTPSGTFRLIPRLLRVTARAPTADRARSKKWTVSSSVSRSARAMARRTSSETPATLPAFDPGVVLRADAGELHDFFAPQARHAPSSTGRQAQLLGPDPGPTGRQEVPDALGDVHGLTVENRWRLGGGLFIPPINGNSLMVGPRSSVG